jgi:hypothetical protein
MRSLADVLEVGPSRADPPENDCALLDELERAVTALADCGTSLGSAELPRTLSPHGRASLQIDL